MSNSSILARPNLKHADLPRLALAGRAVLTFRNRQSGGHMTVRLKQLRDREDRKKLLPIYYVSISLLGDHEQNYRFAGTLFADTMHVKVARDVSANDRLAVAFRWVVDAIRNPMGLVGRVDLFHEGQCCKCGQPLTHPESIHTALGPKCLKAMLNGAQGSALTNGEAFVRVS